MTQGLARELARVPFGQEFGFRRYRVPVRNKVVNVAAAGAGVGFGTVVLAGLPQGYLLYAGGVAQLGFSTADTDVVAAFEGQFSIGTTPDADGTLATTEIDLIAATDITAASRVVPGTIGHHANSSGASSLQLIDNSAGTAELNLNVTIDAADITDAEDADLTVNGYVDLVFCIVGDD
jgi:hypothetical protein